MTARPPRWLIAAILADGAVLGILLALGFGILEANGPYEAPYFQLCGAFAFGIFAGVALWLWLRPSASRWGLAIGLHVIGIMIAGGWLILLALGLGMSSTLSDDDLRVVGSALGLLLAQLVLAVVTYRAAGRAGVESRLAVAHVGVWKLHVAGIFSLCAVLVIGLTLERVELARGNRGFAAMRGAVHRVQGCAARYADRHPAEGYAPTLDAMGPHGDGCLDARTIAGRDSNGVAIEYVA